MDKALLKSDLRRRMKRFFEDERRGISIDLFADLCGVHPRNLRKIFIEETETLTENVQIRVSRALMAHQRGQLRVMEDPISKKRHSEYRPRGEEKPRMVKAITFKIAGGAIKLSPGVVNRQDYSRPDLDELLGD
jgi:hypothetical protein